MTLPEIKPASQFCCGCTMKYGMKVILGIHFLASIFFIIMTTGDVIWKNHNFQVFPTSGWELAVTGYSLAGLPIIALGLYGVLQRIEVHVRFYFYYMIMTMGLDLLYVLATFVLMFGCGGLITGEGAAFACGASRATGFAFLFGSVVVQFYCLFFVWSFCEDLAEGGHAKSIGDLNYYSDVAKAKRLQNDPYAAILGLSEQVSGEYGSVYEAAATSGLGGSSKIFGNTHEISYPPGPAPIRAPIAV
jgi:hypothetical protein